MNAKAVIGANFGNEGKGLVTDYLTNYRSIVIRFNGGAQASHTVVTPGGKRHIFSHIGSGSFKGADTYLSKYFVANPILFSREIKNFNGLFTTIYIDPDCYITTPYDILYNRQIENKRALLRYGSSGIGFNETIERNETSPFTLNYDDLWTKDSGLKKYIEQIRDEYFLPKIIQNELDDEFTMSVLLNEDMLNNYIESCKMFLRHTYPVSFEALLPSYDNMIFEGAQGLLLDQNHSFFPHVTRSNTGLTNVLALCNEVNITNLDVYYVTRCYLTRHGAGPMPGEISTKPYEKVEDLTNVPNDFQGSLRFGYLNIDFLKESIKNDLDRDTKINITSRIVVTCMDQVTDWIFYIENNLMKGKTVESFERFIPYTFDMETLFSYGATRENIFSSSSWKCTN